MEEIEVLSKILANIELPLIILALLIAYRIGGVARGVIYIAGILLVKCVIDGNFGENFWDYYPDAEKPVQMAFAMFWYFFYIFTSVIALLALYFLLRTRPFLIRGYVMAFVLFKLCSISLQLSSMVEIAYFTTNYTKYPYEYGIPILNIFNLIILGWGLVYSHRRSKDFGERIGWG